MHPPGQDRRHDGVRYQTVSVLDDAALGALFDAGPVPWAVINTVGGYAPHAPLDELDPAELTGQLNLNLVSAALVTKHALRRMRPAGEGRIVHTASRAARVTRAARGSPTRSASSVCCTWWRWPPTRPPAAASPSTASCPASSTPPPTGPRCHTRITIRGRRFQISPGPTCSWPPRVPIWYREPLSRYRRNASRNNSRGDAAGPRGGSRDPAECLVRGCFRG